MEIEASLAKPMKGANEPMVDKKVTEGDSVQFERLLFDISARFVNILSDRVDEEIELALKQVLEFFQADRCALLEILLDETGWRITHVATQEGVPPVPLGQNLPRSILPWAYDKLTKKREALAFARLDELPAEANVDRQTYIEWGIRSNLNIPVMVNGPVSHVIVLNSLTCERDWPDEFIPRLKLLGEIFVNALARRNADLALYESEAHLSLAAASADAGLWGMEPFKNSLWVTDKLREIFRFEPEEALSFERLIAATHPEDRERVNAGVQESRETGGLFKIECRLPRPDGEIRTLIIRGRHSAKRVGLPERLTGVALDITERKEMETRLREQVTEIERLKRQLEAENLYLRQDIKITQGFEKIVGSSDALNYVLFRIEQVASTDATVLILGETGTGKGLVANAIHGLSARKDRPMLTVNCAALPANLIESELFGREKGAFTGAHGRQAGRFEVADGGTIFLDEIGELPLELQSKLLRVLQDGEFERLGSANTIKVDVRSTAGWPGSRKIRTGGI
ncbi:MAG: sigma 54-interacting transcriptional regulator [Desulfobacterales bacterium]|jgi:PAS domain S-box-containing protein|nr:sigma 54-interacting transcriptional regulator [Desulfobacterales bacterium]